MMRKIITTALFITFLTGFIPCYSVYAQEETTSESAVTSIDSDTSNKNDSLTSSQTTIEEVIDKDVPDQEATEETPEEELTKNTMLAVSPLPESTSIPNPQPVTDPFAGLRGLSGNFDTDLFSGGGSFSYPIDIPQGRKVSPSISLQYSTLNTRLDSITGHGWELPIGAIFRSTNKGSNNIYSQNEFSASLFGNYEELISTNISAGEYRPKIEGSFSLYTFDSANNKWTMKDKQGTIYTFGSLANARQADINDSKKVYKWMLEKTEDTNGNNMSFTYLTEQGQIYADTITYTGHNSEEGIYKIRFDYEQRPYPLISYATGFSVTTTKQLKKIQLQVNQGNGYETKYWYELSYERQGARVLLTSIQLKTMTDQLPATKFFYQGDGSSTYEPIGYLQKIITPYGGITKIQYQTSTQYKNTDNTLSNSKLPLSIKTVRKVIKQASASEPLSTTTYGYEGGHYYFDARDSYTREYAGFHTVTITDPASTIKKLYFHQSEFSKDSNNMGEFEDHISKKGRIFREEIYDSNNNLFQKTIKKWNKQTLPDDDPKWARNFVFLQRETTAIYDGNADYKATGIEYTYDQYGNNIQSIDYGEVMLNDQTGAFTDTGEDKIISTMQYASNTISYIVSLPWRTEIKDFNNTVIGETKIYYDNVSLGQVNKGNPTKTEQRKNTAEFIKNQMQYNEYGLATSITNAREYTTNFVYDSYHLFPQTITNAKNQNTTYTYNYTFGAVETITDPNKAKTTTFLDSLGRLSETKITNPLAITEDLALSHYTYDTTNTPNSITKISYPHTPESNRTTGQEAITIQAKTYFDGFGKTIQTRNKTEGNDTFVVGSVIYDERGNVKKELLPVLKTGLSFQAINPNDLGTSYTYDALNRAISVVTPIGTTNTSYDNWQQTIIDAENKRKDVVFNARGNLIEVKEYLNAIPYSTHYTYNSLGNLMSIEDAENNVKNFRYDLVGNMVAQEDLHTKNDTTFGAWNYKYDVNNNLVSRTDPKQQTVIFTYDALDRILTENYTGQDGMEATYMYDQNSNGIGRLSSIISSAVTKNYQYDLLGKILSETKTIDTTNYAASFTYDIAGNVLVITYPDNLHISYTYNNAGLLEKVFKETENVISNLDYSPIGAIQKIEYANGVSTTNTYDMNELYRLTHKTTLRQGSEGQETKLQDISYTFDKIGNIINITDTSNTNASKTASYGYDDLYRLKNVTVANTGNNQNYTQNYTYSSIGNILSRSDTGSYSYAGGNSSTSITTTSNPHAVTNIAGTAYSYDANGNLTSNSTWTHSWDYNDRLISSTDGNTTLEYKYDEGGNRVKKINTKTNKETRYVNQYYDIEENTVKRYIYAGGMKVATLLQPQASEKQEQGCIPPESGDWHITDICTFTGQAVTPANIVLSSTGKLLIADNAILEADLKKYGVLIENGGGVLIKPKGTLRQTTGTIEQQGAGYEGMVYHHTDHLTGSNVDTDAQGNMLQLLDYYPFGDVRLDEKTSGYKNDFKFTGKELDDDTNLYYYGARYYDSKIGRFASIDPLQVTAERLVNPQGLNGYSYVLNNPLKYIDPFGLVQIYFAGDNSERTGENKEQFGGNSDYFYNIALSEAKKNMKDEDILVLKVNTPEEINNALEKKGDTFKNYQDELITELRYYGHGGSSALYFSFVPMNKLTKQQQETVKNGERDFMYSLVVKPNLIETYAGENNRDWSVGELSTENFNFGAIHLYSCNARTYVPNGKNITSALSSHFKSPVYAANGGVSFGYWWNPLDNSTPRIASQYPDSTFDWVRYYFDNIYSRS